jgi:hypothetical protein
VGEIGASARWRKVSLLRGQEAQRYMLPAPQAQRATHDVGAHAGLADLGPLELGAVVVGHNLEREGGEGREELWAEVDLQWQGLDANMGARLSSAIGNQQGRCRGRQIKVWGWWAVGLHRVLRSASGLTVTLPPVEAQVMRLPAKLTALLSARTAGGWKGGREGLGQGVGRVEGLVGAGELHGCGGGEQCWCQLHHSVLA